MTAVEETTPDTGTAADGTAPVIEISDVWKLHKLGDEVVRALVAAELQVMPGEFVCLMGPSGSGAVEHHRRAGPAHQGHGQGGRP
jgi:putative ABC transport system ATP-binding protein